MIEAGSTVLPRVVVIGCGFGGIEAVRVLSHAPVEVTLIDRTNHHLFQPLLYQVATGGLAAPSISAPIRHVLRRQMRAGRLTILLGDVVDIDPDRRDVVLEDGERLRYDHLVVAAGATHSYFGHDEWMPHAPGLKTLADGIEVRRRVLLAFEFAEREPPGPARDAWLTFAVIGAGPTGVELAGTMAEIAHHTLPQEFRRIDSRHAKVILIEGGPRVLAAFPEDLSARAAAQLSALGVEVRTQAKVSAIDRDGLCYESAQGTVRLDARTMIWAAGVAASPLGRILADRTGARLDRAGRVVVEPDLGLAGHPEISVVGDLAAALSHGHHTPPRPVPAVSPAAKQMGRTAAANIVRRIRGEAPQSFRYIDYGALATIGRKSAVAMVDVPVLGTLKFSGHLAWLFWLFVHIFFLIGFRNRFVVLLDWAWAYWTFARFARVVGAPERLVPRTPPSERVGGDPRSG